MTATRPQRPRRLAEATLERVMRRYRSQAQALERTVAERDEAIRQAMREGIPRARIAALTGLSKPRLDQIRRGARL